MAVYLGDFVEDATVHFIWDTVDGGGASVTRATDGTVSVYKDNGVSQSTAGVTDTEDFDGVTGIHACTIDLSADAFYATGSNYTVVLTGAVIDGETVNAVLVHFSIENRYMRGTDSGATASALTTHAAALATHDGKLDTAQLDLDTLTGADGVTLATLQAKYAPAKAGDAMTLANDAITAAKYDESTAFPVKSADTGASQIARVGADGDTLETLSDQIDTLHTLGTGAISWPYVLTDVDTGDPIADARVWVTSDVGGSNIIAAGTTNQSGRVTFYLDGGTVYVWRQKTGWDFDNPDTELVS